LFAENRLNVKVVDPSEMLKINAPSSEILMKMVLDEIPLPSLSFSLDTGINGC
jgi:hypothetical protein